MRNNVVSAQSAQEQATVLTATIGRHPMTGTVHKTRRVKDSYYVMPGGGPYYQLVRRCGMTRSDRTYLSPAPDGTDVTCRRCQAL
jgi:hypothetical protein